MLLNLPVLNLPIIPDIIPTKHVLLTKLANSKLIILQQL